MSRLSLLCLICLPVSLLAQSAPRQGVEAVLESFHRAAAEADWDSYFGLMTEQAVFLGTDAGERWPREVFEAYARPTDGWIYTPQQRHIELAPEGQVAWFDEILDSRNYGTSRGTGVLLLTDEGWKIAQYHLTFPIPNALADEFTSRIKAYEAAQQTP